MRTIAFRSSKRMRSAGRSICRQGKGSGPVMGIRYYKPTSAGRRGASVSDFADITDRKKPPEKTLVVRLKKNSGRNFHGKITTRHRGGGARTMYRLIDFKRNKDGVAAKVGSIEYDPNRSCRIALLHYVDGSKAYILAPE